MLDTLKALLTDFSTGGERHAVGQDEVQLATGALLFHVIAIDGAVTSKNRALLTELLKSCFRLGPEEASSPVEAAEDAESKAVDLYSFTRVLKRRLEVNERERVVAMMSRLVFADGIVHELGGHAVAELLGVSTQARIRLKQVARTGDGGWRERDLG